MKYLFCLCHPAQFHLFKNIISDLRKKNHSIIVLITNKDVLIELCSLSKFEYYAVIPRRRKQSYIHFVFNFFERLYFIFKIVISVKPDLLLGSEITLPLIGRLCSKPSIIFSEDDVSIIPQFSRYAYPFTDTILSPLPCDAGRWDYKKIGYLGYQKLAYLHENWFNPDISVFKYITKNRFFILRFSELNAYHDKNKKGISTKIAEQIIKILNPYGQIIITSERKLESQFEEYRIKINPLEIHSLLYYADLYIGDSQSMAIEASILGTPNIRFNDFVEEIGVLRELEKKYNLTCGIKTNEADRLYEKINEILNSPNIKQEWQKKRNKMLKEKIDVSAFCIWFIENFPNSINILKKFPDYQKNFIY